MTKPTIDPPNPIFGFLQPGEKTTRPFSKELPEGYVAILQRMPHSSVGIADQTSTDITLENSGEAVSPYMVIFLTEGAVRAAMGAKNVADYVLERWFK